MCRPYISDPISHPAVQTTTSQHYSTARNTLTPSNSGQQRFPRLWQILELLGRPAFECRTKGLARRASNEHDGAGVVRVGLDEELQHCGPAQLGTKRIRIGMLDPARKVAGNRSLSILKVAQH